MPITHVQPPATRDDIRRELEHADDGTIERILALGPTVDHLHMAKKRLALSRTPTGTEQIFEAVRDAVAQGED